MWPRNACWPVTPGMVCVALASRTMKSPLENCLPSRRTVLLLCAAQHSMRVPWGEGGGGAMGPPHDVSALVSLLPHTSAPHSRRMTCPPWSRFCPTTTLPHDVSALHAAILRAAALHKPHVMHARLFRVERCRGLRGTCVCGGKCGQGREGEGGAAQAAGKQLKKLNSLCKTAWMDGRGW
eukprot:50722-Chlamydomonas_euryale.AAC.1